MYDKWSERFAQLEAMFLARSFQVPVEPVQKFRYGGDGMTVYPTSTATYQYYGQKKSSGAASQREVKKITQPVEAPGAVTATQSVEALCTVLATSPVEAPDATSEMQPTGQDSTQPFYVDRPRVQPPGPALCALM